MRIKRLAALLVLATAFSWANISAYSQMVPVKLVQKDGKWQLERGGKPFYVKGAAGGGPQKMLADVGGNTNRTWDSGPGIKKQMDEAQNLGITIIPGVWVGQVRQGFNWKDSAAVQTQVKRAQEQVRLWKDHPATLVWGVGNEMEADDNEDVWKGIELIAKAVKEIDPNHPTMTVIAEVGGKKIEQLHKLCPSIDIVGINTYGGVGSMPERYRKAGGTKPYMITEYGPCGIWEVGKNKFGAADEWTSTFKGDWYAKAYEALAKDDKLCLGSVAFTWGNKMEATMTWFGMLLPDNSRLESVDRLAALWGKPVSNRCPQIEKIAVDGVDTVKPEGAIKASVKATDPENDPISYEWMLADETMNFAEGGDFQEAPPTYEGAIVNSGKDGKVEVKMPAGGGLYRLYVIARDGKGGAATANTVLKVDGPVLPAKAQKIKAPVTFIGGDGARLLWIASGYMGEHGNIKMEDSADQPHSGSQCIKASFTKNGGWAGVMWQHPANDWGRQPGGFDLTGAKKLVFWARGNEGGETVTFGFGGLKASNEVKFPDSSGEEIKVTLAKEWKEYSIDLSGKDLTRIKTGFKWIAGSGPTTFFIDDVRYE
ncbi:MAG TPA: hypothetical protein DET40_21905 [Lentisphaeria bacterium]|nr:MAG: hypothetical protein A2X45_04000 [Lentisphaerae bacterium GWF2_50_93]HCE46209.1 hypothetical protein [Lentisphaeria bacterium]